MKEILVLYYSHRGSVERLAQQVARGIDSVAGLSARLRTVPKVSAVCSSLEAAVPEQGPPYVEVTDLQACIGLALGSPTRFGNMAAPMKYFWDSTITDWQNGTLIGKPACVFTSSASMHGGQESTLLSMMLPLLHHGMLIAGIPFSEQQLSSTQRGGTPYGASHVSGADSQSELTSEEKQLAFAMGRRLAEIARKLQA